MYRLLIALLILTAPAGRLAAQAAPRLSLSNPEIRAVFDDRGLASLEDLRNRWTLDLESDGFEVRIDGAVYSSAQLDPVSHRKEDGRIAYTFLAGPYRIEAVYELRAGWRFVSKQLFITAAAGARLRVNRIDVARVGIPQAPEGFYIHRSRFQKKLETGDYGIFLRFPNSRGLMMTVQNPFLAAEHAGKTVGLPYMAERDWKAEYGPFTSDRACLGLYQRSGRYVPERMTPEWQLAAPETDTGLDESEVEAFTECVRSFLSYRPARPLKIFVGWCVNDYQIDVASPEGRAEYKRLIDAAAELGAEHILYAPTNSETGRRQDSTDDWNWENLLWLGLGQKIRRNEWDPATGAIPASVQELLDHARARNVRLVAYVYPVLPFLQNRGWLVEGSKYHRKKLNASLGSREFQDWLIRALLDFQRHTGISGYAFDYSFLWYEGTSHYAQWWGWRRVMETLRKESPDIVIDGRQLYMEYGPWIWLAGSYPHPTAADEQPESFVPFPDLHFDRVSANRQRYTAWRYRMHEFCPTEIMPGFITHQTPRIDDTGKMPGEETGVPFAFRRRDWDYLGWRYSLLSSIATAAWNHVLNMIPARDTEEYRHFSSEDKAFLRRWLDWTSANKETFRYTRAILGPPRIGAVDGTAAIRDGRGFVFLFNPNGRRLAAEFQLDESIGLVRRGSFLLRELYPQERLAGKPGAGFWQYGDRVRAPMDGASAMVLALEPASAVSGPVLFNTTGRASLEGDTVRLDGVRGEVGTGQELAVLLSKGAVARRLMVNGGETAFRRRGDVLTAQVRFAGERFAHSQQVGAYDAAFAGGTFSARFRAPRRVFDQLQARKKAWPIPWTKEDLRTTWLAPDRLLLFVQIAEPSSDMDLSLKLNGGPVPLEKAYSSIRVHARSFAGFYADLSSIEAGKEHLLELRLPKLKPGQFQGVFFDNVEPEYTTELAR